MIKVNRDMLEDIDEDKLLADIVAFRRGISLTAPLNYTLASDGPNNKVQQACALGAIAVGRYVLEHGRHPAERQLKYPYTELQRVYNMVFGKSMPEHNDEVSRKFVAAHVEALYQAAF